MNARTTVAKSIITSEVNSFDGGFSRSTQRKNEPSLDYFESTSCNHIPSLSFTYGARCAVPLMPVCVHVLWFSSAQLEHAFSIVRVNRVVGCVIQ